MSTETLYRLRPTVADSDLSTIALGAGGLMMHSLRKHAFAVGEAFEWYGKGPARTITSCVGFPDLAGLTLLERFIEPAPQAIVGPAQLPAGGTREDVRLEVSKTPRLERPDGGPAYPLNGYEGMSMRDFFAGQAVVGLAMHEAHEDVIASWAYKLADAMLRAREAKD